MVVTFNNIIIQKNKLFIMTNILGNQSIYKLEDKVNTCPVTSYSIKVNLRV